MLGIQTQFSCLSNKLVAHWAIFPALVGIFPDEEKHEEAKVDFHIYQNRQISKTDR